MKKHYALTLGFLAAGTALAQVYNGPTGPILNNGGQESYYNLNVSGLPSKIDSTFGLVEACISITHPAVKELNVTLISPWGIEIPLTGVLSCTNGSNFSSTCFNSSAGLPVTAAPPPYTGTYRPLGNLGRFNAGKNPNGIWKLSVKDFVPGPNAGTVDNWSLRFGGYPAKPVILRSSNLPIVFLNTTKTLSSEQQLASLSIIDNGSNRNNVTDPRNHFNGKAMVHTRGSSSKMFEKPNIKLELRDASGQITVESPMLGMPSESDWVLTAGYTDKSLLRNALTQHLYRQMGYWSPRTRFVELVLNNEYFGVYMFMEKPKRSQERINVPKMTANDNSSPYLTGGYIMQINRTDDPGWYSLYPGVSASGSKFYYQYEYPKPDEITAAQKNYIKAYVDSFETVMASPQFSDRKSGYRKFINDNTFVDFMILNELSKNPDAYKLSTYLYKDNIQFGNKLSVGPMWDYDIAWHNCDFGDAFNEKYWQYNMANNDYPVPTWWKTLMTDKDFRDKLYCRYRQFRNYTLSNNEIYKYIDSQVSLLSEAQQRNFRQFPILGAYVYPNPQNQSGASYQAEVNDLKNWVFNRASWMDANISGVCPAVSTDDISFRGEDIGVFPNPFSGDMQLAVTSLRAGLQMDIRVYDITGNEVVSESHTPDAGGTQVVRVNTRSLPAGVYFVRLNAGGQVWNGKVSKAAQ
jgi:subtilisin-like proprotein convertase family protein